MKCLSLLMVLLFAPVIEGQDKPKRIGAIEFYGYAGLDVDKVRPAIPAHEVWRRCPVRLNGKTIKIVCRNNSKDNKYIQSIRLNGKPLNQVWFRHADIVNGGTLELQMGNTPNEQLGSDPASFPPSEMALN